MIDQNYSSSSVAIGAQSEKNVIVNLQFSIRMSCLTDLSDNGLGGSTLSSQKNVFL